MTQPFLADFHIHSHYSRATSKELDFEHLDYWARLKGIKVVGTGDFTHPAWLQEMKDKLVPTELSLFRLKDEYRIPTNIKMLDAPERQPHFLLTAEISNIYKKFDQVRKVHNVVFAPNFETVEKIQAALTRLKFNITSDGRPILGMDSRDLLELCLNASPDIFFVPAHIWTPWFSALGSKSGFDSIDECYGDLTDHIHTVETGLSSDAPMNYLCTFLDKFTLISNSDAHSPEKLGRNANRFACDLSYPGIIDAIKSADPDQFLGTIDLFPQEGKYHYDGHRKCGVCWNPVETRRHHGICPECGKEVTVGVMNRVVQLADRANWEDRPNRLPFHYTITLKDVLAEILGVGSASNKVEDAYQSLLAKHGAELDILLVRPPESLGNEVLTEGIRRMRNHEIYIEEGYDGEYGRIKVFAEGEAQSLLKQSGSLFVDMTPPKRPSKRRLIDFDLSEYQSTPQISQVLETCEISHTSISELNPEQQAAVEHHIGPAIIIAGPGTGKTKVLTHRIAYLVEHQGVDPENILAMTFTNKAAEEMQTRLSRFSKSLRFGKSNGSPTIGTFHALGHSILKEHADKLGRTSDFSLIDSDDQTYILLEKLGVPKKDLKSILASISRIKQASQIDGIAPTADFFQPYETFLRDNNLFDLDDLIYRALTLFRDFDGILDHYRARFQWIMVDEFQDINGAQYDFIKLITPTPLSPAVRGYQMNLTIIGDPNQAIYGFRGASVGYFQKMSQVYPDLKTYKLTQSYRCSNRILTASNDVLQTDERFLSGVDEGVKINISEHVSDKSEAEFVARTIEQVIGGLRFFSLDSDITTGYDDVPVDSLSNIAVLCRTKAQFAALEKAFHDHTIPYQAVGEEPFYRQEPFWSMISVLKYAHNPDNAFLQDKLRQSTYLKNLDLGGIADVANNPQVTVKTLLDHVIDSYFEKITDDHHSDIKRLLDLTELYGNDVGAFLRFVDLGMGVDTWQPHLENVNLMTLHAAKGLEFACVFIVGCEDGLIPHRIYHEDIDLEEERRIIYVGMTRAKKFLYLTYAKKRLLRGREQELNRSPFLDDIERGLLEEQDVVYRKKEKPQERQMSLF